MQMSTEGQAPLPIRSFENRLALNLIHSIQADLERLRGLIQPQDSQFDPKDSRNKTTDGKFTPRGVEVCYRLFDMGKTRYAVAEAMNISFGAATHRLNAWKKAGGRDRKKMRLD
jgi:DNA-binding NarL/FixJ family response regulator